MWDRPWWAFFVAAVVVYLLQLIPLIGILMMFTMAPYWSVVLVNMGFITMAIDGYVDDGKRYLLLGPILWFGGYFLFSLQSHLTAASLRRETLQANASATFKWDPQAEDIMVATPNQFESLGDDVNTWRLVDTAGLQRAYEKVSDPHYSADAKIHKLVHAPCPRPFTDDPEGLRPIWLSVGGFGTNKPVKHAPNLCLWDGPAEWPAKPVFIQLASFAEKKGFGMDTDTRQIAIYRRGEDPVMVRSVEAKPVSWLPLPVAGCALDSGAAKWVCQVGFMRDGAFFRPSLYPPTSPLGVVATALGLKLMDPDDRMPSEFVEEKPRRR